MSPWPMRRFRRQPPQGLAFPARQPSEGASTTVSVLQRKELEDSPLADLHAIASELGIEGYRALRREDLVGAIMGAQGGEEQPDASLVGEPLEPAADTEPAPPEPGDAQEPAPEPLPHDPDTDDEPFAEAELDPEAPEGELYDDAQPAQPELDSEAVGEVDLEPPVAPQDAAIDDAPDGETAAGTLDILPNGSGFIRVTGTGQSSDDVYVSPAQIRRCELRAGDHVSGPVRPPRRSERHPSLVRVTLVNGRDAEPPEVRPDFADLVPVHPTQRLPAPAALDAVPFGRGSRVAISGGPGAGTTRLLREVVRSLLEGETLLSVVLVGARPEEVTEWEREEGLAVAGGSFDRPLETQIQAVELAVERAKRVVERGGDAAVIIDSLELLPPGPARRLFGAARNVEEDGSLTVIAAVGGAAEPLRQASTRIVLDDAAQEPAVLAALSGTQRADLLA